MALGIVAILAAGLGLAGETWETEAKREKEAELLFVGNQYRNAIRLYYENTPGGVKRYPRALQDLLSDSRGVTTRRYLRRLYRDPLGGHEWGLVKAVDGGISGVYSLSPERPTKVGNFKLRDAGFDAAQRYSDWQFVYAPVSAASKPPGPPAKPPAAPIPGRGRSG